MVIFHSYVKLLEGITCSQQKVFASTVSSFAIQILGSFHLRKIIPSDLPLCVAWVETNNQLMALGMASDFQRESYARVNRHRFIGVSHRLKLRSSRIVTTRFRNFERTSQMSVAESTRPVRWQVF